MNRSSRSSRNVLPPPTASEAAFERVLREMEHPAQPQGVSAFVESAFANSKKYLERDPFAGIGERDSFPTKVVGITFEGRQDVAAGLRPGMLLELHRRPENPVDPNAIAVQYGNLQIGFLRAQIARHLAPLIDGGAVYRARIEHVTGGPSGGSGSASKHYGVNILVERETGSVRDAFALPLRSRADREALRAALIGSWQPHEAQRAVLARIDSGKNTLAVFGTGRGKSFCFQFAAACRALESRQKTLVLYPLRALANDQYEALVRRLDGFGLRIHRANGAIGAQERAALMDALRSGAWDMILATPEFLQFHRESFAGSSAPDVVVVDEAHHVFESKHRAAYARLAETLAALGKPQVIALTATAGEDAFRDILEKLGIDAWVVDATVRENLCIADARGTRDKAAYLLDALSGEGKAIVYCNSRSEAVNVAESLRRHFKDEVMFYHAGMPTAERLQVETFFRSGELRIVVATSAFGEGIDLPDVRDVVLYHLNFDFTEFNQQAGRAGRDGAPARVHLLFGAADRRINDFINDTQYPTLAMLRAIYKGLKGIAAEGIIRTPLAEVARVLEFDKANDRTVGAAVRIFEDEGLVETGIDEDGRYVKFLPAGGKVDMTQNDRFAEGEAAREDFARFCDFVLSADAPTLERIINRPIYPERIDLVR